MYIIIKFYRRLDAFTKTADQKLELMKTEIERIKRAKLSMLTQIAETASQVDHDINFINRALPN